MLSHFRRCVGPRFRLPAVHGVAQSTEEHGVVVWPKAARQQGRRRCVHAHEIIRLSATKTCIAAVELEKNQ